MNYEKIVRQIRQKMFDYSPETQAKAEKVLKIAKEKMVASYLDIPRVIPKSPEKNQKPFYPIRFFGGRIDEVNTQIAMVKYIGGHDRAERLSKIRNSSYPLPTHDIWKSLSAKEVFRIRAKVEGFTDMEIDAFESL